MNKKLFTILAILTLTLTLAAPIAYAEKPENPGKKYKETRGPPENLPAETGKPEDPGNPGKGKPENPGGNVIHLYLYEKDPETWEIIEDGAWGKLTAIIHQDMFVFNGHALTIGDEYSLIYYPDPWPGKGLMVLGSGVVNEEGNIHIMGQFDFDLIPIDEDTNDGAKIWLVLKEDVSVSETPGENSMMGWTPEKYLFENNLIL